VLIGLRPLERSARSDGWIKGTVSWDVLRRAGNAFEPAQARWFTELYSIARDMRLFGSFSDASDWLTLDDIESHLLWSHLATAADHGIALVPTKKNTTVEIARDAAVVVHAKTHPAGIDLTARISIDGADAEIDEVRPVGHIGVYRFGVRKDRIELTLAPLALPAPVHALVSARAAVTVPAADVDEFLMEHLPRLLRQAVVEAPGIDLPAPERPTLIVTVRFSPAHRLDFALEWRYGDRTPVPYDAPASADRDRAAEDALRHRVEAVWRDAATVAFASAGRISGIDAAEFASRLLPALEAIPDVSVVIHGERPRYRELTGDPHVTVSTVESTDPDWFDLGVIVTIDGRTIPFAPLFTRTHQGRRKLLLSDGRYFSLAHPSLQRLRDLIEEAGELAEWETGPASAATRRHSGPTSKTSPISPSPP
jgi:hypothetical protein